MSKYRITVEGKTYEMDVELIGANGAVVAPSVKSCCTLLLQLPRQLRTRCS